MDQVTSGIRIVSICGSVRPDNFTVKALRLIEDELRSNFGAEVTSFDLAELSLPMPGTGDSSDGGDHAKCRDRCHWSGPSDA